MESIKQQQYVAIDFTLIFLFLSHQVLRVNYRRNFKKGSEQRSNKRSTADSVNYLFGIHIPFLPHYQNPDSCKGQQHIQMKPLPASRGWQGNTGLDSEM